jgi:hypothetical protein
MASGAVGAVDARDGGGVMVEQAPSAKAPPPSNSHDPERFIASPVFDLTLI